MIYIFAVLFFSASVYHLFLCEKGSERQCAITKSILMPLLAFFFVALMKERILLDNYYILITTICALFFGWLGDVLLLKTDEKHFMSGATAFLIGHIFWIYPYAKNIFSLPLVLIIIIWLIYLCFVAMMYIFVGKPKGIMALGVIIYGSMLCLLNFTGIATLYKQFSLNKLSYLVGSVFFILSDIMLAYSVLKKDFKHSRFLIMITYITAQTLLVFGILPQAL